MGPYHLSPTTGRPNRCTAKKGNCPAGTPEEHYGDKADARAAYEAKMSEETLSSHGKKPRPSRLLPQILSAGIKTPPGFTREATMEEHFMANQPPIPVLILEGDGITIRVEFTNNESANSYQLASGHVNFTTDKGLRTFDQRGLTTASPLRTPTTSTAAPQRPNLSPK